MPFIMLIGKFKKKGYIIAITSFQLVFCHKLIATSKYPPDWAKPFSAGHLFTQQFRFGTAKTVHEFASNFGGKVTDVQKRKSKGFSKYLTGNSIQKIRDIVQKKLTEEVDGSYLFPVLQQLEYFSGCWATASWEKGLELESLIFQART